MDLSPQIDYGNKWIMPTCPPPPIQTYEAPMNQQPESSTPPRLLRLPSFTRLTAVMNRSSSQQRSEPRSAASVESRHSSNSDVGFFVDFDDEPTDTTPQPPSRDSSNNLPRFSLKPRPSKPSNNPIRAIFNTVRSTTTSGLTRVSSTPLFTRRNSESKSDNTSHRRPSMSRRPSFTFIRRPSFSMSRSPSFSLSRRPSFSRAA